MHIKPKKRLGQNFLIDPNIQRKIVRACELLPTDTVIEIGSGRGELTKSFAGQVKRVFALELDGRLIETLENNLREYPNVSVLNQDVLKVDLGPIIHNIGKGELVVIGNIPYYITTPIIERLFSYKDAIGRIFLTVQKEFARRIAAPPGSKEYGAFSCFVQYHAIPEILFTINRTCFRPAPKPDSAFIKLKIRSSPSFKVKDEVRLFKIIRAAFGQRRKTLRNSLEGIVPLEKLRRFFDSCTLEENSRPERLSLEDFIRLANI
ncbi:MAG: 16S rRNA (adenine(1518)-N(6)/adenine(1519)-N(6))-dimethyltransferase RsmA [Candidatus Omnitrophica bacterium]|nr:16S rRNA (adenine(1518)-N(6)/adenine(1519)-N(6))-dimethyltransferase RsmA [Candidatus Omnitrophota bacterium]